MSILSCILIIVALVVCAYANEEAGSTHTHEHGSHHHHSKGHLNGLHSQNGNPIDSYVLRTFMNEIKFLGTFVEFGCADGITNSNTYDLEQLGWYGLCIEANVNSYNLAKRNGRKHVINSLIGPPGNYTFFIPCDHSIICAVSY
jgi:hypothetical protein